MEGESTNFILKIWKKSATKWIVGGVVLLAGWASYKHFTKAKTIVGDVSLPDTSNSNTPIAKATTIPEQTAESLTPDKLPNNGVGCSPIRTNYDLDFNYIKCNGVWYTKLKPNPRGKYTAEFRDWKSLEGNKVAIDRLNIKYPND